MSAAFPGAMQTDGGPPDQPTTTHSLVLRQIDSIFTVLKPWQENFHVQDSESKDTEEAR